MINSNPKLRTRRTVDILKIRETGKDSIEVRKRKDGLDLKGDGFEHSITVSEDTVQISRLDGTSQKSFPRLPYSQTTERTAYGVAAIMTGLPVLAFSGEKPEKVYVNLAARAGLGHRHDFSHKGGRYRVTSMDAELDGGYILRGTKNWGPRVMKLGPSGVKKGPVTELTDGKRYISNSQAYKNLSGTDFAEQVQSGLVDLWKRAGGSGTVEDATSKSAAFFGKLYDYNSEYATFTVPEKTPRLLRTLNFLPPETSWKLIEEGLENSLTVDDIAKKADEAYGPYRSFPVSRLIPNYVNYPEGTFFRLGE